MDRKSLLSHGALLAANTIYAITFTVAKGVMPTYISPLGFIFLRVTGAVLLFTLLLQFFKRNPFEKKDYLRLILCGISGVALNQMLFFKGLNLTTPISAAVIMTSTPILVFVGAVLLKQEFLNAKRGLGIALGAGGAIGIILLSQGTSFATAANPTLGNIYVFINAAFYATYLLLAKPLMKKYDPLSVIQFCFMIGWLVVLPFGWEGAYEADYSAMPQNIILSIGFVVIFTTFFAYLLNIVALKNLRASTVSFYIYAQPLLASLFAVLLGSDTLDWQKVASGLAVFLGVYLVSVTKKKQIKE
jgi:drug/metabolite transporter (DMT)-like permease